jgi:hypothetical protein
MRNWEESARRTRARGRQETQMDRTAFSVSWQEFVKSFGQSSELALEPQSAGVAAAAIEDADGGGGVYGVLARALAVSDALAVVESERAARVLREEAKSAGASRANFLWRHAGAD